MNLNQIVKMLTMEKEVRANNSFERGTKSETRVTGKDRRKRGRFREEKSPESGRR